MLIFLQTITYTAISFPYPRLLVFFTAFMPNYNAVKSFLRYVYNPWNRIFPANELQAKTKIRRKFSIDKFKILLDVYIFQTSHFSNASSQSPDRCNYINSFPYITYIYHWIVGVQAYFSFIES